MLGEKKDIRKLAGEKAKKRAKQDAIIVHFAVFISILFLALCLRTTVNRLGYWALVILGILVATASSWTIKERNYNKYYQRYLQELAPPEKEANYGNVY